MKKLFCIDSILVFAFGLLFASATNAATITVATAEDTNNANDGVTSLREAISSAVEGDTITFAPSLN